MADIDAVLAQFLNDEQRAAATDPASEVLTLACAGSGKSRTLSFRIAWLIAAQGATPESIVAFTFTEKAADSIKLRVASALGAVGLDPNALGRMYIGTIHSYCQHLLGQMDARYRQFEVLDENRLKLYLVSRFYDLHLQTLQNERGAAYFKTIHETASAWAMMNEELIFPANVIAEDATLGGVLQSLGESLDQDEFIDFSLMQRLVVDALAQGNDVAIEAVSSLQYLLVDEYQDINPVQDRLISLLHENSGSLFVVGDDDQSIYGWRGADVSRIINFADRYPNASTHTLDINYRSTHAIVRSADTFAATQLGAERIAKEPDAIDTEEPREMKVLWFDQRDQEVEWTINRIRGLLGKSYRENGNGGTVRGLTPADFAILMRSTKMNEPNGGPPRHDAFTRALEAAGISYSLEAGGGLFDRAQVSALRSTFELLRDENPNRNDVQALMNADILPAYPNATLNEIARVLSSWGRKIHAPYQPGQARQRIYPQQMVYDLLEAFGVRENPLDDAVMQDIGVFSRIMQDVETVYMSVDRTGRFRSILNFLSVIGETGYDSETYEVSQRPDAVTVSTVHKMKGLEFPVVFIVDVENQRFPKRRRAYSGWLPSALIQDALNRGAYQSTPQEETRLFYTAVTRAERFLYVTGSENSQWTRRAMRPSPYAGLLQHDELSDDPATIVEGLTEHQQIRRLQEVNLPTTYSEVRYYLRCPKDYQFRKVYGFSPPIADLFGFGQTVHAAVAKLHEQHPDAPPTAVEAAEIAANIFHVKHVPQARDPENHPGPYERAKNRAVELVQTYAEGFSDDFERRRQVEARFEIPSEGTVISGAIDLMLLEDDEGNVLDACVVDFKTMEGGETPLESDDLEWAELALQVQLYARAARDVLGQATHEGHVHLLKDNQRIEVPVNDGAVDAAIENIEWAVQRIVDEDFPMRPHVEKCGECDFAQLCQKEPEGFRDGSSPPPLHVPGDDGHVMAPAFRLFDDEFEE